MAPKSAATAIAMLLTASLVCIPWNACVAQQAPGTHDIPVSIQLEHQETMDALSAMAGRQGPVGEAASKALEVVKAHVRREEEYILPPLTLLPVLADGRVTPDMKWAIAMADRVKADREQIFQEHAQVTQAMIQLLAAAQAENDADAASFARSMVADSLSDLELVEPMVVTIGEYLRAKLAAGH